MLLFATKYPWFEYIHVSHFHYKTHQKCLNIAIDIKTISPKMKVHSLTLT